MSVNRTRLLEGTERGPRDARVVPEGVWLRAASYLSILVVWAVASRLMASDLLPGPLDTLAFAGRELERGALLFHLWATTRRVLIAFVLALVLGVVGGAAMGASRRADRLLEGWLVAGLTIPRIILFVMAYLLLGLSDSAAIAALVLTITPSIAVQVREGTRAVDGRLVEMARAYKRSRAQVWRHVVLPQILPYVVGTARASLSLAWKMVVLAELIGRTSGVGYQISFYFQMFNMKGILAYGLVMMLVLAAIDLGVLGTYQRRAFRWRRPNRTAGWGSE